MSFRVGCGDFRDVDRELMERPGRALLPLEIPYAAGMFAARGLGESMLPKVPDGWWLFFHLDVVGTRRDRYVLVEDQNNSDVRYTLKKYHARKKYRLDGTWEHDKIVLVSLNPAHPDIVLERDGIYQVRGWYVGCAPQLERVEPIQYPDRAEE